jgi:hypothetical protein
MPVHNYKYVYIRTTSPKERDIYEQLGAFFDENF